MAVKKYNLGMVVGDSLQDVVLLNKIYPIGSYYFSGIKESPASFLGGTWEQITDVFIRAADDTETGGSDSIALTIAQLAEHDHAIRVDKTAGGARAGVLFSWNTGYESFEENTIASTGNNEPHSNMPAYQDVYCWKRIS